MKILIINKILVLIILFYHKKITSNTMSCSCISDYLFMAELLPGAKNPITCIT